MICTRCVVCGRFAWWERPGGECDPPCSPRRRQAAPAFWRDLLAPSSPLISQPIELREVLSPLDGQHVYDALFCAAGTVNADVADALDGIGLLLTQAAAQLAGSHDTVVKITLRIESRFDVAFVDRLWRYALLLQGLAAGHLPARQYVAVHDLLRELLVPDTARTVLGRVTTSSWARALRPFAGRTA